MIWFVIVFIIACVVAINIYKEDGLFLSIFCGVSVIVIGGAIAVAICHITPHIVSFPRTCIEKNTVELVAIGDNTNTIHGQFFLGCGEINGTPTYVFYKKTNSDGYILNSLRANDCIVYEREEQPNITYYKILFAKKWYYLFAFNVDRICYTIIVVPPNSITKNIYNFDLK